QKKPVRVYFLTYAETMQTRLMQLMAQKLTSSLAIEGELTDKGLAALSESSDSMAIELAKMLIDKSRETRSPLKDIWADYRKKEVKAEGAISISTAPEPVSTEGNTVASPDITKASNEVERIGDRIVRVQFIEYTGKRKRKVTHIEVREAELDEMLKKRENAIQAQFSLF
ncbi:MAG: hypothetical protein C4582_05685, partial [Desulfobacteraceae bacterium]